MRLNDLKRPGTTVVECAVVYPLVFIFLLGLVIGAMGILRYQEVASLARRGARYACVHGTQYARDTHNQAATPTDIYNNAIDPYVVALDKSQLSYSVSYNQNNAPTRDVVVSNNGVNNIVGLRNQVSVTVNYTWISTRYFGSVTLTSTSTVPMSN
jgi:Flp pilus assembly protein TadG